VQVCCPMTIRPTHHRSCAQKHGICSLNVANVQLKTVDHRRIECKINAAA